MKDCTNRTFQCDSVRPLCGRCKKANYACTWDGGADDGVTFRNENVFAQGQARRPWKKKSTNWTTEVAVVVAPRPQTIPVALPFTVETHAVNYWVENFTFQLNELPEFGHEYSSYVIEHWRHAAPDSTLHVALLALAHGVFGRTKLISSALDKANKYYVKTMEKLKEVIDNIDGVANKDIDALLLTVMLMGSYENTMWGLNPQNPRDTTEQANEIGSRLWQNIFHHKGAGGLLGLRKSRDATPNPPLDKAIRRQLIRIGILRGMTPPPSFEEDNYGETGPMRELDALILRVSQLRGTSLHLFGNQDLRFPRGCCSLQNIPPPSPKVIALESEILDAELAMWAENVPKDWEYSTSLRSNSQNTAGAPTTNREPEIHNVHDYNSHAYAVNWNRYRAARMIVNSIHIRALEGTKVCPVVFDGAMARQDICLQRIHELVPELCSGVQYFFNSPSIENGTYSIKIGDKVVHSEREILPKLAALVAWPLTVAACTEYVPEAHRKRLRERLNIVAEALGDKMLADVAEKIEFKF